MRLAWTRENVAFANPCFNGNGRDMTLCEPTLAFQTYTTQQDNTAQSRVNDAIQFDNTFTWFKPGLHGRPRHQAGRAITSMSAPRTSTRAT